MDEPYLSLPFHCKHLTCPHQRWQPLNSHSCNPQPPNSSHGPSSQPRNTRVPGACVTSFPSRMDESRPQPGLSPKRQTHSTESLRAALRFLIGISSFPPGQSQASHWSPSWPLSHSDSPPSLPSRCAGHPAGPSTQALTPGSGTGCFSLSRSHSRARLLPPPLGSNLLLQGNFSSEAAPLPGPMCSQG